MNNDFPITTKNTRMKADDSYIVFSIQDKQYAINITNVIEVINIPTLNAPETLPVGIIGIFNYKETIIKAIDICPLLGFEPNQPKKNNKFIIINSNNNYFAIHTDAVINIFTFDKDLIQKIPYSANNSILKEIYKNETNQISIVDINALNNVIELNKDKENGFNYLKLISENNDAENLSKSHSIQTIEKQKLYAFNFNLVTENQYILFTLNNDNFYIDLKYIKEFTTTRRYKITKLTYTAENIKGLINLKGEFLIVIDLKLFLGLSNTVNSKNKKLIILERPDFNIALLVDDIKYIQNLNNITPSSINNNISKYVYSEFIENEKLHTVLNAEKIINDERLYIDIN